MLEGPTVEETRARLDDWRERYRWFLAGWASDCLRFRGERSRRAREGRRCVGVGRVAAGDRPMGVARLNEARPAD